MNAQNTAAIELHDVEVRYGTHVAATDIDLKVAAGELHVLLGKSGSGKTTLLRALAGFETVARGQISLFGTLVDQNPGSTWVPPERRGIGLVFQDYALFPHLTVGGNVAFGMQKQDARKIDQWLDRVGLGGYATRPTSALSGGEQQRVALARALAVEPRLMLFDEPFSNLDRHLRHQLRQSTAEILRQEGVAAVFVTHDAAEAFALGDRLSVMHQSLLLQSGSPRALYHEPQTREVARALGEARFLLGTPSDDLQAMKSALGTLPLRRPAQTTDTHFLLRPEQLCALAKGTKPPSDGLPWIHVGPGKVTRRTFQGPTVLLDIAVGDTEVCAQQAVSFEPAKQDVEVYLQGPVVALS